MHCSRVWASGMNVKSIRRECWRPTVQWSTISFQNTPQTKNAEKTAEINFFMQQEGKTAIKFSPRLWDRVLRSGQVYEEYRLKEIIIDGLTEYLRLIMRNHWGRNNPTSILKLARYEDSILHSTGVGTSSSTPPVDSSLQNNQRWSGQPIMQI